MEYTTRLAEHSFGSFDSAAPAAFNSDLLQRSRAVGAEAPAKMKRLAREFKAMQSRDGLPLSAAASIFVRHDESRLDVVRF